MSEYWLNDSCSPFAPFVNADGSGSCTLGNLAVYAIDVVDANSVIAGINFAQQNNIRLIIKNTGHDLLGRSVGEGSLALWTHNLKSTSFFNYTSAGYNGPAVRIGAGIEVQELYDAASAAGVRATAGSCPTVGAAGGWFPGGGHGPLMGAYGLGSDNTLEFEVVTANGQHINATAENEHSDLYWALSGGGPGNYAVVLSITAKTHSDGPVAGASFVFNNDNDDNFWSAIKAWMKQLLTLNAIPGFKSTVTFNSEVFELAFASLPDASQEQMTNALAPYFQELDNLNISVYGNSTTASPKFLDHYNFYTNTPYTNNNSVAGRLIPNSIAQDDNSLDQFIDLVRTQAGQSGGFNFIASNVSLARAGVSADSNSVLPAWRDSLFSLSFGLPLDPGAPWSTLSAHQATINQWQDQFRDLTPGSGAYMNEATYDNPNWKDDYFGVNYDRLLSIKQRYDPNGVFWANAAVGSDLRWALDANQRLCRV